MFNKEFITGCVMYQHFNDQHNQETADKKILKTYEVTKNGDLPLTPAIFCRVDLDILE